MFAFNVFPPLNLATSCSKNGVTSFPRTPAVSAARSAAAMNASISPCGSALSLGAGLANRMPVFVPSPAPRFPDPGVQEGQFRDYCMRSRGYRLVPDEKQ